MLAEIGWETFLKWKTFEALEPFPDERADWNAAHIVQNVLRTGRPLREYLLPFGDSVVARESTKQSIEFQTRLIDMWCSNQNAIVQQKANRGLSG